MKLDKSIAADLRALRVGPIDEVCAERDRLRRDNARLRGWTRRWTHPMGRACDDGANLLRVAHEAAAALKGDAPPKRRAK